MANENRAKHAFGMLEKIDEALSAGKIDKYDILFVKDENGKPYVGWIDSDGNKVICDSEGVDLSGIQDNIEALESAMAKKAKKYEVAKVPECTLVDYFDKEIRILINADTDFTQDNGVSGDEGKYYIEGRIYAPDGAVKYKVDFGGAITEGNVEDFSDCTDEYGRVYIANALPAAYYNAETAAWVYYGANSTTAHYIGWNQVAYWYDANGMLIGSDSIRINLSNEDCHYVIEPYYVSEIMAEVESAYEVVEF